MKKRELSCNCSHRFLTISLADRDDPIVPLDVLTIIDIQTPNVLILGACLIDMLVTESADMVSTFVAYMLCCY